MKALVIGTIHSEALELLKLRCQTIEMAQGEFDVADMVECEAVVFRALNPMFEHQLKKMPHLRYAVLCSVGQDNLDFSAMKSRNIELISVPGTNANSVAEHVMYLLFSLLRDDRKMPFAELAGKTAGLCGFGAIGKAVAEKLSGCGCQVIAYDIITPDPAVLERLRVRMVDFDELFSTSDIISIHVPLMKVTENLIDERAISLMKDGAFLINTSRAEVVDEAALLGSLHRLRGVGLDVYTTAFADSLKSAPVVPRNVILTPHVAAQGENSYRMQCVRPVEEFIKGLK